MKIGYARVSSTGQNEAAQVELLSRNGAERMFVDKASGTNRINRPKLAEALAFVREGDTLVVTRLDRLARSVPDLHAIAAIAEFENDLRRERQAEGIAKAKAERRYKGRPACLDVASIAAGYAAGERPAAIAKRLKIARSSVYRVLSR